MKLKYKLTKKKKKLLVKYFFLHSRNIIWTTWAEKSNAIEYLVEVSKSDLTIEKFFIRISKDKIEIKEIGTLRSNKHLIRRKGFWYVCGRDKKIKREIINLKYKKTIELDHENLKPLI